MSILREENDKVIKLLGVMSKELINSLNNKSILINMMGMSPNLDSLINAMLVNHYNKALANTVANGNKPKGFIRTINTSWLNQIDMNKYSSDADKHGLLPIDHENISKLTTRLSNEISRYNDSTLFTIKEVLGAIKTYINSGKTPKNISDAMIIDKVDVCSFIDTITDKGYLDGYILPSKATDFSKLINILPPYAGIADLSMVFKNDAEVSMLLNEQFKDTEEVRIMTKELEAFLTNVKDEDTLSYYLENKTGVEHINQLMFILLAIIDTIASNSEDGILLKTIANVLVERLNILLNTYNRMINNKDVVVSYTRTEETSYTITVLSDTYDMFLEQIKDLDALYGRIIDANSEVSIGTKYYVLATIDDLMLDKDRYINNAKLFKSSLMMETRLNETERVKNYIAFAVNDKLPDGKQHLSTDVLNYVSKLTVGELTDLENVVIDIYSKIVESDTNFSVFVEGYENASSVLNKATNPKIKAAYGALYLIVTYLTNQTEIV